MFVFFVLSAIHTLYIAAAFLFGYVCVCPDVSALVRSDVACMGRSPFKWRIERKLFYISKGV